MHGEYEPEVIQVVESRRRIVFMILVVFDVSSSEYDKKIVIKVAEEKAETFVKELKDRYYTSKGVAQVVGNSLQ